MLYKLLIYHKTIENNVNKNVPYLRTNHWENLAMYQKHENDVYHNRYLAGKEMTK